MNPLEWITSNDTGTSSKTIWAVMMGAVRENAGPWTYSVPLDPSDFGRCYRLLTLFPEWKARLPEVGERFPAWKPMIREWPEMEKMYLRDLPTGESSTLYDLMQKLEHEGRILDGWVETSPGCYKKTKEVP